MRGPKIALRDDGKMNFNNATGADFGSTKCVQKSIASRISGIRNSDIMLLMPKARFPRFRNFQNVLKELKFRDKIFF